MPGTADSGTMASEKIMGKSSGDVVGGMEHGFRYDVKPFICFFVPIRQACA